MILIKLNKNIIKTDKYINLSNTIVKQIFNLSFQNNLYFSNFYPLILENIKELFFINNKITNSYYQIIENFKFEIKNRNALYNNGFNNLISNNNILADEKEFKEKQKSIFLKSKKKEDKYLNENDSKIRNLKNFIYEKKEEFNKKYIYNNFKNILNQHCNKNEKENINKNNILNYSHNYQTLQGLNNIFNNNIKIKKNNKMIYMNSFKFMIAKSKNKKKLFFKRKRTSKYRGVSKNGNHWQTLIMNNRIYSYIGTFNSEKLAARIYDLISLKKKGINAKTNFIYCKRQIQNILLKEINFKDKDINYEKINSLINDN